MKNHPSVLLSLLVKKRKRLSSLMRFTIITRSGESVWSSSLIGQAGVLFCMPANSFLRQLLQSVYIYKYLYMFGLS